MKVRPPTLREKRRYILARILPGGISVDPKDLYYAVAEAATSLWGDDLASRIHPAVVTVENGCAFVRCRRGMERELAIALSTTTVCSGQRIALRTIATSGTMESLRARLQETARGFPDAMPAGTGLSFGGRDTEVVFCESQKIDVVEKGFKNAARFYLTTQDLEDSGDAATIPDGV